MNNETFNKILKKLQTDLYNQKFLSLCGLGEPLIDKNVQEKIKIAKEMGFRGIGIYTNGTLLDEKMSENLLDAKLDTLIISIDGVTSKTQESIRIGSDLNKIVSNVEHFIALREREKNKAKTRIIIRFTKQELNKHEENDFYNFWRSKIKMSYDDSISIYNVCDFNSKPDDLLNKIRGLKCPEIYERLVIFSDGSLALCCFDQFGRYEIGNILDEDPVKLYNSKYFIHYRELMRKGEIQNLELCKNCPIVYSIATRQINK